jgi:hypothetical protein
VANASARAPQARTDDISALRVEALNLQQQLYQEATTWSGAHTYYDSYDGKTYNLGYEYQAIAYYPTQNLLNSAQSVADYQYIIGQLNGWLADFNAYTTNFSDPTHYNQVHATDQQLMQQNGEMAGQTIVISLAEQAMRVYQDSKLSTPSRLSPACLATPACPVAGGSRAKSPIRPFSLANSPARTATIRPRRLRTLCNIIARATLFTRAGGAASMAPTTSSRISTPMERFSPMRVRMAA